MLQDSDPNASVFSQEQEHVASSSPAGPAPSAAAAAAGGAATPSPILPISTDAQEADLTTRPTMSMTTAESAGDTVADTTSAAHSVAPAVGDHDRVAQALRDGFLGAAGAISTAESADKTRGAGEAAAQPGSAKAGHPDRERDKPPAGVFCFVSFCFVANSSFVSIAEFAF